MAGRVVFWFVLSVMVFAMTNTMSNGLMLSRAEGPEHFWDYPYVGAAKMLQNYTVVEQFWGFLAGFIVMGVVAIIAKTIAPNKRRLSSDNIKLQT